MNRDLLDQAARDIELLTRRIATGTRARPEHRRVIDIALAHMVDWADTTPPPRTDGPRGGSSSPVEVSERAEDRKVGRDAHADHAQALTLIRTIHANVARLHSLALRYTVPIDHTKLPSEDETLPGCVSCARTKKRGPVTIGGHFAPVYDRPYHRALHLCRWCGEHQQSTGGPPSIEACDVYHRQGPRAAGRFLAKQQQKEKRTA